MKNLLTIALALFLTAAAAAAVVFDGSWKGAVIYGDDGTGTLRPITTIIDPGGNTAFVVSVVPRPGAAPLPVSIVAAVAIIPDPNASPLKVSVVAQGVPMTVTGGVLDMLTSTAATSLGVLQDISGAARSISASAVSIARGQTATVEALGSTLIASTGIKTLFASGKTYLWGFSVSNRSLADSLPNGRVAILFDGAVTKTAIDLQISHGEHFPRPMVFTTNMVVNDIGGATPSPLTLILERP